MEWLNKDILEFIDDRGTTFRRVTDPVYDFELIEYGAKTLADTDMCTVEQMSAWGVKLTVVTKMSY